MAVAGPETLQARVAGVVMHSPNSGQSPSIVDRIYEAVDQMPKAMARMALYVSQNPDQVIKQSVVQLGENTNSGQATIIRLCKFLGYDGFKELKMALAFEVARERAYRERAYSADGRSTGHVGIDSLTATGRAHFRTPDGVPYGVRQVGPVPSSRALTRSGETGAGSAPGEPTMIAAAALA